MHVSSIHACLLILLFLIRLSTTSDTRNRPYSKVTKTITGTSQRSNRVHNITLDCGDPYVVRNFVQQCQRDLLQYQVIGYPWSSRDSQDTNRNKTLRDALDSLNHVCHVQDRSQACLEESGILDYCLAAINFSPSVQRNFKFICHHRQRDVNLVHSLQCLHDTRVMAMLYFHIANRCSGMSILDDNMRRYKNAYFYRLDINSVLQASIPLLYCLPKSVISTCIRDIVEDHCGVMTADLVQNYLFYLQDVFDQELQSAGLNSNICDEDSSSDMFHSSPPISSDHHTLGISRLLGMTAPGTALDTVNGKSLLAYLHDLSGEEFCTTANALDTYQACVMSSDDKSEKGKFNILQFAHQQLPLIYHGTRCSRMEQFTACWNLLQQICGRKVRGLEQHATLFVEGCEIQSELENVGCNWQDMLLPHYIQASRVTVWPIVTQGLRNPMLIDDADYSSTIRDDLDTVISLLQPGVEEISWKCGTQPAKRLRLLLNKLRYLQRDALKFTYLYMHSQFDIKLN